jgi:hypothetical protein
LTKNARNKDHRRTNEPRVFGLRVNYRCGKTAGGEE